jgi:hypothetical protein
MNVQMPDGTVIQGIPEGTPKDAIWAKYQQSKGGQEPMPTEGPGFLERSYDNLVTGASDAMSSAAGDVYDEQGNKDEYASNPMNRAQNAILDVAGGVGAVAGDALISGGKAVLPQGAQDAIGAGVDYVAESAPVQALGAGWDKFEEAAPDYAKGIAQGAELGTLMLPKLPTPSKTAVRRNLGKQAKKLRDSQATKTQGRRADKVGGMLEPEDGYGRGETDLNVAGTSQYTPTEFEAQVIDEVAKLPKVSTGRSLRFNEAKVSQAARKEVADLNKRIDRKGNPDVDVEDLNNTIGTALDDLIQSPEGFALTGDAQKAAQPMITKARNLIEQSDGTVNGVLQARRDFDAWVKKNNKGAYNPDIESAASIAKDVVRTTMNDYLDALLPSAKIKQSLEKTHKLITAKEVLRKKAAKTSKTKIGRAFEKVQGFIPTTPLAVGATGAAGFAALAQPWLMGLAALGGTGYAGVKALQYGTREWRGALAKSISGMEKLIKAAPDPKIAAELRLERMALIDLLKDEKEAGPQEQEQGPQGEGDVWGDSAQQMMGLG